eukprot:1379867-Amorphochlora_amoeboformis.AAC.1
MSCHGITAVTTPREVTIHSVIKGGVTIRGHAKSSRRLGCPRGFFCTHHGYHWRKFLGEKYGLSNPFNFFPFFGSVGGGKGSAFHGTFTGCKQMHVVCTVNSGEKERRKRDKEKKRRERYHWTERRRKKVLTRIFRNLEPVIACTLAVYPSHHAL